MTILLQGFQRLQFLRSIIAFLKSEMIAEWVRVGQGDVLYLEKLLLRSFVII